MKKKDKEQKPVADFRDEYPKFTKEMKHTHKILVPDMLPVHFGIIVEILKKTAGTSNFCTTIPARSSTKG